LSDINPCERAASALRTVKGAIETNHVEAGDTAAQVFASTLKQPAVKMRMLPWIAAHMTHQGPEMLIFGYIALDGKLRCGLAIQS
jgi:hypothetical protein